MNKNSKFWSSTPRPIAYSAAVGITLVAFAVRFMLQPHLQPYAPFQLFFIGSVLTEYLFGLGPALFSLAIGTLLGTYYFIAPYGTFDGQISRSDVVSALNFIFITFFIIGLIEYLKRTLYAMQLLLKVSQSHHKISLFRENDRLYLAKKAATAVKPFEKLFADFPHVLLFQLSDGKIYPQALFYRLYGRPFDDMEDWLDLFDATDHPKVRNELTLLDSSDVHHRALNVTLRDNGDGKQCVELQIERIVVGHQKVTAVKLIPLETSAISGSNTLLLQTAASR